jgi:phospholipid transport system substrate-binding protein
MIDRRRLLALVGLGLCVGGWQGPVAAVAAPELAAPSGRQLASSDAGEFIVTLAERAVTGLADPSITPDERSARFRTLLNQGFDVPAIARFALGRYWRLASEAERQEYLLLFEKLTIQTYAKRFTDYAGEKLKIVQTRAGGEGDAVVASELLRPTGPAVKVDWRVRRDETGFKIFDVVIEGVSMSVTQRDEFSAVIQRTGGKVDGLLATLREKTGNAAPR